MTRIVIGIGAGRRAAGAGQAAGVAPAAPDVCSAADGRPATDPLRSKRSRVGLSPGMVRVAATVRIAQRELVAVPPELSAAAAMRANSSSCCELAAPLTPTAPTTWSSTMIG
jgi:hypothetical protein